MKKETLGQTTILPQPRRGYSILSCWFSYWRTKFQLKGFPASLKQTFEHGQESHYTAEGIVPQCNQCAWLVNIFLQEERGKKEGKKEKKKKKKEAEVDYPKSWLISTIYKTFKWVLIESAFFKLLQDLLAFVSPQLLKWVNFSVKSTSSPPCVLVLFSTFVYFSLKEAYFPCGSTCINFYWCCITLFYCRTYKNTELLIFKAGKCYCLLLLAPPLCQLSL